MATFVNQTSNISALGPKFDRTLSVGGGNTNSSSSSSSNDVDGKSVQAQQFLSSLRQRTVVIGHEIEEMTTYLLPPAVVVEEEEQQEDDSIKGEIKTISELATLTRSAQQMTSSKLQTLMEKLGINKQQLLEDNNNSSLPPPSSSSSSSTVASGSKMTMVGTTPQRGGRGLQGQQHHLKHYHRHGNTMSPHSHPKTPSASPQINRRNNKHQFASSSSSSTGAAGDLFSNLQLSSSPSSLLSNLLLDGPLESVAEADYETDTTTPASSSSSSTMPPSAFTTKNTPASSSWSGYKSSTNKNSSGSSDYIAWKTNQSSKGTDQRHFQSPRNPSTSNRGKSFHSPPSSSMWSATKKQQQKSSSTSPLTPPPMNSLSFSNSTSTFLQRNNTLDTGENANNDTTKDQQNYGSDAEEVHRKTNSNNNIFSPYDSSPLSSSSSLHDTTTAISNRPKTPALAAALLLRPSPTLPNGDDNDPNINNNNNNKNSNDKKENLNNFLPLDRALNFEFREDDDMITLDTQSTLGTAPQAQSSTTKQAQSQSQSQSSSQRRRRASSMTSTSTTGGGGGGGGIGGELTAEDEKRPVSSSATKEDRNDFFARMEGMLERVEESMMDDNGTTNSSFLNNNLDEPSRPSDEMNASMFRRHPHRHRHQKSSIRGGGSACLQQSAPTTTYNNINNDDMENEHDDPSDSSSNDDSTNIAPTVVQDKGHDSNRDQRPAKLSSTTPVGQYKERPTTQIVVDQSLPSPAHTNITMDNTMLTAAEFGGLEDFELPVMKNIGMGQKKNRMSIYKSTTYPSLGTSSNIDESENDPDLDCLSVLTPVLDRYRVEPGGDNSSDIKVIPNQRRPHPSHEAYRKKKMTVKHRVEVGTGSTPHGGVDGSTGDDEYQGITPIMSNVPTVSAFQSPPPSSKIKSTPVSSVTSRKKKVYPKTPIPGKFGSKTTTGTGTGGENSHPNTLHRTGDDKKQLSFLSPVGNARTDDTVGADFVVPRLRPSTLDSNTKRIRGRRVSNAQLASVGRQTSDAVAPDWSTATPSSSLARAQRNWESRDFSSSFVKNDEPHRSASSSAHHESGRTNPVGVRLSKSPL